MKVFDSFTASVRRLEDRRFITGTAKYIDDVNLPSQVHARGVKGAGEAGCCGAPPAIVNAVLDALAEYGVTHLDMPLTPMKVWRAINDVRF